jgi:hypothetical protein
MKRRINSLLFIILDAGWFGHTRTAEAIASQLLEKGFKICFLVDYKYRNNFLHTSFAAKSKVKFYFIRCSKFGIYNILRTIKTNNIKADIIHQFENRGLFEVLYACFRLDLPHIHTICSQIKLIGYYPSANSVFLAKEFLNQARIWKIWTKQKCVITNRINTRLLEKNRSDYFKKKFKDKFFRKYQIAKDSFVILRVCQVNKKYYNGLIGIVDEIACLSKSEKNIVFIHIGFGNKVLVDSLRKKINYVNSILGRVVAISAQDEYENATAYINMCDILIGSGRTAFEGMFYEKPIIVADINNGKLGKILNDKTFKNISYFNFSGRGLLKNGSLKNLTSCIKEIKQAPRANLVFNKNQFNIHYNSIFSISKYLKIYENAEKPNRTFSYWLLSFGKFFMRSVFRILKNVIKFNGKDV